MTESEIKYVAITISNALLASLRGISKEHKYSWHIAEAALGGMIPFVMVNSEVYYASDKVENAEFNLQALYELAKADQLKLFYSDIVGLSKEIEKALPSAIEESIEFGCISFTDDKENSNNNILPNKILD